MTLGQFVTVCVTGLAQELLGGSLARRIGQDSMIDAIADSLERAVESYRPLLEKHARAIPGQAGKPRVIFSKRALKTRWNEELRLSAKVADTAAMAATFREFVVIPGHGLDESELSALLERVLALAQMEFLLQLPRKHPALEEWQVAKLLTMQATLRAHHDELLNQFRADATRLEELLQKVLSLLRSGHAIDGPGPESGPAASRGDCPFYGFWHSLIGTRELVLIHAVPVYRRRKPWNWPSDKDREGIALLERAFSDIWPGRNPVLQHSSGKQGVDAFLESHDILLSGGAVSNSVTRTFFNHFWGIRYVIGFAMPDYTDIHIEDRKRKRKIRAEYRDDFLDNRTVSKDVGILTVMRNPMADGKCLVGCMGIHGFGSLACFKALSDRALLKELMSMVRLPLSSCGYQVLVDFDIPNDRVRLRRDSLHEIPSVAPPKF